MKFKKLIATVLTAAMISSVGLNLPFKAIQVKAAADYSYLDAQAYSGNDLGATYTKTKTTFKVWAPTASKVQLKRYTRGSDSEPGASIIGTSDMTKGSNGVWYIEVSGDLKDQYYTYLVTNNGVTKETVDLYAKAVGVNGNRGMVIDLDSTDPVGWSNDSYVTCKNQTDAIVWEAHVRDFSIDSESGMNNKGKFLAFTETNTTLNGAGSVKTGVNYLKDLGVTHVQLLPIYDYATVDETKLNQEQYNWGYDPKNYNAPEGSYSTNPYDGNVRVKELKQAIQSLHNEGIGVIMDVVYNHTYDENNNDSWFNRTVPGYYYRHDNKGFANGSGCGNETASERIMFQKYMIESLKHWMTEYHIDGFRFDLMGLHDVETMNLVKQELEKINPNVVLYGEPWNAGSTASSKPTAIQSNMSRVDSEVGAFNDKVRDAIKGSCFNATSPGFIQGAPGFEEMLKGGIQANSTSMSGTNKWSKQPSQTVTYTSAHDNYTLWDKLIMTNKGGNGYDNQYDDLAEMNKMAGGIILTAQGISFIHAGEEFARTKYGDENSYKSSTAINRLDWDRVAKYGKIVDYYKGLIEIRKAYTPFRDPTNTSNGTIYFSWGNNCPSNVVAFTMYNKLTADTEWNYVGVIHNANSSSKTVTLQGYSTLPSQWVVIADGNKAGVEQLSVVNGTTVTVPARSTVVLVDKQSFDKNPVGKKGEVVVKHVDKETGKEIAAATTITGKVGTSYSTSPIEIQDYILSTSPSNAKGNYIEGKITVTYEYVKDNTPKGTVTVKYLDKASKKEIASSKSMMGKEGTSYSTEAITIRGYELDTTSLPSNSSGKYTSGNIEVIYYYNEKQVKDLTVHYYNSNNYSTVYLYAYMESGATVNKYTGNWPGTKMTNEGNGWWSYEVTGEEAGSIILNNGGSLQEPSAQKPGYTAEGEVWIKNGVVYTENPDKVYGDVIVKHVDNTTGMEIASSEILKGEVGKPYSTSKKTIDGYTLLSTPSNATGTYSKNTITVTYMYEEVKEEEELEITSLITDKISPPKLGDTIKITASAKGEGILEYNFVAKKNNVIVYESGYSTTNYTSWNPKESGNYTLICYVKESSGDVVDKSINYTINPLDNTLAINSFKTNLLSPQSINTKIKLGAAATGVGTLRYRFVVMKGTKNVYTRGYSIGHTANWTPKEPGTYTLYCKVMDSTGKEVLSSFNYVVTEASKLGIISTETNLNSPQKLGNTIELKTNGSGSGELKYRFVVLKNGINVYTRAYSNLNTARWKPSEIGTYTIYYKVKDSTGKEVTETKTFVIEEDSNESNIVIHSFVASKQSPVELGNSIVLKAIVEDTEGAVQCKFTVIKDGKEATIQDYSTKQYTTWRPTEKGLYTLKLYAKDSKNNTINKTINFVIN